MRSEFFPPVSYSYVQLTGGSFCLETQRYVSQGSLEQSLDKTEEITDELIELKTKAPDNSDLQAKIGRQILQMLQLAARMELDLYGRNYRDN